MLVLGILLSFCPGMNVAWSCPLSLFILPSTLSSYVPCGNIKLKYSVIIKDPRVPTIHLQIGVVNEGKKKV